MSDVVITARDAEPHNATLWMNRCASSSYRKFQFLQSVRYFQLEIYVSNQREKTFIQISKSELLKWSKSRVSKQKKTSNIQLQL